MNPPLSIRNRITPVILAGGLGTRLRSVLPDQPKPLAPVLGKPFLSLLLDQLVFFGFERVLLCVGYKAEQIIELFGTRYKTLAIDYSIESKPLGTGGAILPAIQHVQSDYLLIMNGDSFIQYDLMSFYTHLRTHDARGAILVSYRNESGVFGHVEFGRDGEIKRFSEKQATGPGWVNAGVYLLSKSWFDQYRSGENYSLEKDFFPDWVGRDFYAYTNASSFIDIGTPVAYANSAQFFAADKKGSQL